ncbi:PLxRFG domain-containing protein [Aeromonas caviae]
MAETNEFDAYWDDKLSQRNLEVGGIDVAKGIAGAAVKGTGSLISNLSAGDIARGARGLVDPTMNKVEEGGVIDTALTWLNDTFDPEGKERQRVSERVKELQDSGSLPKGDGQNKDLTVAALPGLSALAEPLKGAEVIGDIADKAIKPTAKFIGEPIKEVGQGIIESTSPDMQEAMSNPELFKGGQLGRGAGDPAAWAGVAAQAVGSLIPTVATAAITKNPTAGLGVGMGMSVGQAGDGAYETAINSNPMDLIDSPIFVGELKKVSQDPEFAELDGAAKVEEAQRRYAELSSSMAKSKPETIAAAAMGTMLGDATIVKTMLGSGAGGAVRGMLKGAATEAPGEFGEEWLQRYVGNTTQNQMASKQLVEPMAGTLDAGLHGAAGGVMAGGAMGGAAAKFAKVLHANKDNLTPEQAVEVVERSMKNRGVDDATARQVAEQAASMMANPDLDAAVDGLADPPQASSDQNPLGPSASQFDELRDVPAYLRRDDTAERFKGMAADSEVQRALAGEFGQSVQELVASQMQAGDQGKSLYERAQAGELGLDPFAGNKSAQQVAMENQRLAPPLKDVIFAGDANAKPKGEALAAPGDHDDHQAGPGPQFRGTERTRWQSGQEGDLLPPERDPRYYAAEALPGATIEGEGREVGTELPHRNVVYGTDGRPAQQQAANLAQRERELANQPPQIGQSDTIFAGGASGSDPRNSAYTPPKLSRDQVDGSLDTQSTRDPRSEVARSIEGAGKDTDSVFGPLKSLRITRKGKPFASEKEAAMASRKGKETPVPLNGGGFGVAEIAEVEQVRAEQPTPSQPQQLAPAVDTGYREVIPGNQPQAEVSNEPVTPVPAISSERQGDQPSAGETAAAGAGPAIAGLADRAGSGYPADNTPASPVPNGQQQDDQALTAPAPAGVAVSEEAQAEQARTTAGPAAAPTPWSEMIDNPDGTITLKGEVPIIKQWAKDNGVKAIPGKGGLVVSKTSADKVREYAMPAASEPTQQVEAVRADVAQGDTTKPVAKKVRMSQQREGLSVIEASKVVDDFLRDYNGNIPLEPFIREKASEIYGPSVEGTEFARTTKGAYHPSAGLVTIISGNAGDNGSASLSSSASIRDVPVRESENAGAGVSNGAVGEQKSEPGGSRGGESSRERATGRVGKGEGGAREAQTGRVGAKEDLIKTLRHELLGHYGTDTFTPENKRSLLQKLIDAKQQPWLAKEWGAANKGYKHLDEMGRAEEVFASIAEKDLPPRAIQAWNDIKTEFSRMLRKTGLVKGPIKEHELDSLIKAVGKGIRSGERTKQNIRSDQEVIGKQADEPAKDDKPERIIRFSKQAMAQGNKPAKHLTPKEAELVSHGWFKQYRGASGIKVQIHATQAELEGALGLDAKEGLIRRAAFDDDAGTLHVAADTISDPKRMREILRHEVLAHYGLANVLGDGEYTKLMSRLIQSQKDPSMKPVWDWVNTHYADEDIGTQAEEVVAHLAELEQGAWGRGWDRVVAWVTRALRAVGFVPDGITAAETRSLIEGLGKKLQRSGPDDSGPDGGKKFSQEAERPANDGGIKMSQSIADNSPSLEQSITQKAKYQAGAALGSVKNYIKQKRPVMLGTLTDLQIDQVYRDITGGAVSEYQRLRTQMEADRNDILLDAETRIDPLWDALDKQVKTALSNLMHDATMARLHPDKSLDENSYYLEAKQKVERAKKPETKAAYEAELHIIERNHSELARQYNALPANAKALYDTMQDTYTKQWESLRGAIEQRLEDLLGVNQGRAMAAEMRQKMEHALQHGPYFPLTRYGDYVVKARKGDEYVREHFERRADAEQAVKQYQRDGYNAVMTVKEEGGGDSANANQLGMEMLSFLDSADGVSKSALKDEIWQAMLRMMPDASYAKHAIHRRRVKGASRDAHRAYLNSVYHYARHVSKIRYGHKMLGELDKLSEQIRAGVAGEPSSLKPEDLEIAQQVLNEMNKRHDLNMNPTGKAWAGSAGNIGFLYYIGPSVASAVVNMTQNFTVMLPQLGAKYGFAKSAAAMTQALGDYVKHGKFKAGTTEAWHSLTRSTTLPADERAILDRLYRAGALDLTQAHSIAAKADTDQQDAKPMGKRWRRAMRWAGATFHNAEVLNREVAALAAYRLLKQAEPTLNGQQYADRVAEMVYDGHGNYAASNRPRYMRNDITKVLTQFKIYSQMMTYVLYSNAIKAAKAGSLKAWKKGVLGKELTQDDLRAIADGKLAAKTLGGVLATHWVMAGVMGLPTPLTFAAYAIAAGLDDDDDRSGEASFRLALTEALGPRAGELLAKGPMDALTNLSIAGRTGLGDLWWRSPKEGTEGDDLAWHAVQQLLGPVAGIGINLARGAGQMTDGHIQRGLETMLPKSIRDVAKSYRQATEGEQTIKGDIIMDDVSTWNVAMQGLGFGSAQMAKNYDAREYIKGKEKRIADKRSQLLTDYYMARKSGEMDEVQEVLERIKMFNSIHHPRERITGKSLALSFKSKLRSNERTQGGVYLNRNREYLREEGRFAD